ncbi:MAG: twin-arginine translocase TatA/TatE family subunit [Anaerolineaceae bacterium]
MPTLGWPEVIIILVVVILVFGVGRITKVGSELGSGIKAFKEGLNGKEKEESEPVKKSDSDTNK